jgi:predicted transposase/invertase (TIGR01784 family)
MIKIRNVKMICLNQKFDEGVEVGIEKGKTKGKIEVAENILKAGASIDLISESTDLTQAEVKQLQEVTSYHSNKIHCQ